MEKVQQTRGIICIGRSGVDLYPTEYGRLEDVKSFTKHVGGSPANIAVQAAKLGMDTAFLGKIAQDGFGMFVREYLSSVGIDVSHLTEVNDPQIRHSLAVAHQIEQGQISYFFYRAEPADQFLSMDDIEESFLRQFRIVLISGASMCASPSREAVLYAIELAAQHHVTLAFDPDYRKTGWDNLKQAQLYNWLAAKKTQIFCATEEEFEIATALSGSLNTRSAIHRLLDNGVELVCIKKGAEGSAFYLQNGTVFRTMPMPTRIQKSLGAGDSFLGTLLTKRLEGIPIQVAARYAAAAASITISGRSCSDSMPDGNTLESYMAAHESGAIELWFDRYLK